MARLTPVHFSLSAPVAAVYDSGVADNAVNEVQLIRSKANSRGVVLECFLFVLKFALVSFLVFFQKSKVLG